MLYLSEILIRNHDIEDFDALLKTVRKTAASSGEIFFRIDVRPPFQDTPANWEDMLEGAFAGVRTNTG